MLCCLSFGIFQSISKHQELKASVQFQNKANSASTRGELGTTETLLAKAFLDQSRDVGWLPFLQGKISKYWRAA
jgi:hypothetical protein